MSNSSSKKVSLKSIYNKTILPFVFILPAALGVIALNYYPVFKALYMGFFRWDILNPPGKFIGFDNYKMIFTSSVFYDAFLNTVILFIFGMLIGFWVPIVQALLLNEVVRGQKALRVLYLTPMVIPGMSTILLWKWIWNPTKGLANQILHIFGIGPLAWLNDINLSKITLSIPGILGGGIGVIIYLAAIQGIPEDIYEAASLEGIGFFKRIFLLTLPNIKEIIFIQFVLAMTGALQAFDGPFLMTGGGPAGSTTTLALKIYDLAFGTYQFGLASAMGAVMFIITVFLVYLQLKVQKGE
jgi:multiple sugar transport system permease protein